MVLNLVGVGLDLIYSAKEEGESRLWLWLWLWLWVMVAMDVGSGSGFVSSERDVNENKK